MTIPKELPPAVPASGDRMAPPEDRPASPWLRLHLLLYGRYKWAIALGLVLAVCGSAAGWILKPPQNEFVGTVEVKPYIPPIFSASENGVLPMFEAFVDLQASLLESQRILDQASQNPDWRAVVTDPTHLSIDPDKLKVSHPGGSELVTVQYSDPNAAVAAAAVKSVIEAYMAVSGDADGTNDARRLQVLEQLRTSLANQKSSMSQQILDLANPYSADELENQYAFKLQEQNSLESELQRIALQISFAQATGATSATQPGTQPGEVAASQPAISRDDVARVDPQMREYLSLEASISLHLNELRVLGPQHPEVVAARNNLRAVEDQIDSLLAKYQDKGSLLKLTLGSSGDAMGSGLSLQELQTQESSVRKMFDKVQEEANTLGQQDLKIRAIKDQREMASQKLDQTTARIDQLNLDASMANRITVLSYGDKKPLSSKRIPFTIALGLLGLATGTGLIALRGLADRRVRCLLQVEQLVPEIPVLGVLPVLAEDLTSPVNASLAAHCVHQIRLLLDPDPTRDAGRVIVVTSPSSGDGKTSLTLAMGLSFAVSGSRTLLIDCDTVGGGLTARLHAVVHRRLRSMLVEKGLVTRAQIDEALRVARAARTSLARALVQLGYLTVDDIHKVRTEQAKTSVGFFDALGGEPISACVSSAVMKDLYILPMPTTSPVNSRQISAKGLRKLFAEARDHFDVILVDTGPILGSVEASVAARAADEVVLAVTRGTPSPLLARVVELLDSLGARLGGVVFNRASPGDVAYSKYGSSGSLRSFEVSSMHRSSDQPDAPSSLPPRLGPMAAAIATNGHEDTRDVISHVNGLKDESIDAEDLEQAGASDEDPGGNGAIQQPTHP